MKQVRICLIGFGNVSRAFVRLADHKQEELKQRYGVDLIFSAIATGRHGYAINLQGIDVHRALVLAEEGRPLDELSAVPAPQDVRDFIAASQADFLFENSPVNYESGQPAIMHIETALQNGIHVVSANKGPVVHAYQQLTRLAEEHGRRYLFESAVMDGAPIFSVFREALPAAHVLGFKGILNSCTNLLIERMEQGASFDEAVAFAQSIGIAETDPGGDIDGWDAAIKVAALATVLMETPLKPQDVQREGIRELSQTEIQAARKEGGRWKLVCQAERGQDGITASVAPQIVQPESPLFSVNGTSSFVLFKTDVLPGLGIQECDPGPDTTAYGLLADMLNILKNS